MTPVSGDTFFVAAIGEHLTFMTNDAGAVDRFKLKGGPTANRVK